MSYQRNTPVMYPLLELILVSSFANVYFTIFPLNSSYRGSHRGGGSLARFTNGKNKGSQT